MSTLMHAVQARSRVGTRMFHTIWRKVLEKSGHTFPEITITYEDLNVGANALVGAGAINSITNALKGVRLPSAYPPSYHKHRHKCTGVLVLPGRSSPTCIVSCPCFHMAGGGKLRPARASAGQSTPQDFRRHQAGATAVM